MTIRNLLPKGEFSLHKLRLQFHFSIFAFVIVAITGCESTRFMKENESLVTHVALEFKNPKTIKHKSTLETELLTLIKQKPNSNFIFFLPKEYLYLKNSGRNDTTKVNKWLRNIGEPPSIYSDSVTQSTVKTLQNYLQFSKGYYHARVDYEHIEKTKQKGLQTSSRTDVWKEQLSKIKYIIDPGPRYAIYDIDYVASDSTLLHFITQDDEDAFVKKGDFLDASKLELEKSRLALLIQNAGFANFSGNNIEIEGDSSQVSHTVHIVYRLNTPMGSTQVKRFTVGKVNVYSDYSNDKEALTIQDTLNGLQFFRRSEIPVVKESLLSEGVFLKEGEVLKRDDRQRTYKKLNSFEAYRFITINPRYDLLLDTVVHFDILLTPHQKKWILDGALEGYFSTLNTSRLFGISTSASLVNRNLLGGSEKYSLRAEFGTELGRQEGFNFKQRTQNYAIQNNLVIPSFQDFLKLGKLVNGLGIIKDKFYNNFKENATTNVALGGNYLNIIDYYSLNSINLSFGFDYTSPKNNRYVFRPLGFNLDQYDIKDSTRFDNNPLIFLSFKDNLSTGFFFRDLSIIINKKYKGGKYSFIQIHNFEQSGTEVFLMNSAVNAISGKSNTWELPINFNGDKIGFSKYFKYEIDNRFYKTLGAREGIAARINVGIAVPFGDTKAVPFVKQFSVGGPVSLRAWNIKELGPGGYYDVNERIKQRQQIFVNQGDIKIEVNAEYRFNIFLFLDGALFIDAGNVYLLKKDATRPNAEISSKFLSQFGVGIGYGLRLNVEIFSIRFDFGYKIRSPYKDPITKANWYTLNSIFAQGLGNVQVGINYPF